METVWGPRRRPQRLLRISKGMKAGWTESEDRNSVHNRPRLLTALATESPNARVPLVPPISSVLDEPSLRVASTAFSTALPAIMKFSRSRCFPSHSMSIATDKIMEVGLALSCPWMSGADPCCACAQHSLSPAIMEPPNPTLPESSLARSDRISP